MSKPDTAAIDKAIMALPLKAGANLGHTLHLARPRVVAERAKAADWRSPPAKEMTLIAGETHSLVAKVGGAAKRGAPRNSAASKLAGAASAAYEGYTGKRATVINDPITNDRGGPFVEFVEAIFKAAGIDANSANFAKEAAKIRYQVFGPNPVKSGRVRSNDPTHLPADVGIPLSGRVRLGAVIRSKK
jgi:hypothetical protein